MNNNTSIPQINSDIGKLKARIKEIPNLYNEKSNAVSNETSLDRLRKQVETLQNKKQIAEWYGTQKKPVREGSKSLGLIGSSLDYLSRPLYGVVGATKHFIGLGKGSLMSDVASNIKRNKETFGNVLAAKGMSRGVSAPLGFALDIFADPVNWVTMGESAFIPKLGKGLYKGVKEGDLVKGALLPGKSVLLDRATTLGRFTPFFRKSKMFEKLGSKSLASTIDWEKFSGSTAKHMLTTTGRQGKWQRSFRTLAQKTLEQHPKAAQFLDHFVYDPIDWVRQARVKDIMQNSLGVKTDISGALKAAKRGESIEPFIAKEKELFTKKVREMPGGKVFDLTSNEVLEHPEDLPTDIDIEKFTATLEHNNLKNKVDRAKSSILRDSDDAVSIANDTKNTYVTTDGVENTKRMTQDAVNLVNERIGGQKLSLDDISKMIASGAMDKTGIKWFDNMMEGVKNYTIKLDRAGEKKVLNVGKRTMEAFDKSMGIFRVSKVAASPTSWVNAIVGNLAMNYMAGGIIGPKFLRRLWESKNVYYSKNAEGRALMDRIMRRAGGDKDLIRKFLRENSTAAHGTYGDLSFIGDISAGRKGLSEYVDDAINKYEKRTGEVVDKNKIKTAIEEIKMNVSLQKREIVKKAKRDIADAMNPNKSNVASTRELISKKGIENVSDLEKGTGMLSAELYNSKATAEMFDAIAKKAAENPHNYAYKTLNTIFNKAPDFYEKIDQTYKLATFITATVDGYSLPELRRLAKFVDINPSEITKIEDAGQFRYTLHPRTATELTNVMYLNYAAMPAAIKVLRNFPLLGSPFISFMYGMALKTGETMAYNPSAFNKIGFMMKEAGGPKSPLEKEVLKTDKYSYLTKPGMMKLPFTDRNPLYLNMANMLPYYSLNMFNPSGANYGNSIREKLVSGVQSSPVLKDPVGSLIFDYIIQPLILDEATRPQGQFGQSLYPSDANFLEKAGYGARSLGEAYIPNIAAGAGIVTPEAMAKFIPSYRWRQLSRAKVGKNAVGVKGKEPKSSRTLRALANYIGIPIQTPVNKTYIDYNKKHKK